MTNVLKGARPGTSVASLALAK